MEIRPLHIFNFSWKDPLRQVRICVTLMQNQHMLARGRQDKLPCGALHELKSAHAGMQSATVRRGTIKGVNK
ncbi:MAG: hypothetical protein ACPG48_08595, partial [Candidatus Puniceispirillaceae bacterium]